MRLIILLSLVGCIGVLGSHSIDGIVNIKCGSRDDNMAVISYFGESRQVAAFMQDGKKCTFLQDIPTATWSLTVALRGPVGGDVCSMRKVSNREIYSIDVVSFRRSPDFESEDDEKFLMECNFERYKEQQESSLPIIDSLMSQQVVETHEGAASSSNYSISVVRIDGTELASVEVGSLVKLRVKMSPSAEEEGMGFMPTRCEVLTPDAEQKSIILIEGCGTGYPFKRNRGFHMSETAGISPTFRMFRLNPKKGIAFKCSFVTCNGDCTQSTCPEDDLAEVRLKRAVPPPPRFLKTLHASTGVRKLEEPDGDEVATDVLASRPHRPLDTDGATTGSEDRREADLPVLETSGPNRVYLIGNLDSLSFTRTVKLAVLFTSVVVLCLFVAMTVVLLLKFRDLSK